jgi:hypothetical protein
VNAKHIVRLATVVTALLLLARPARADLTLISQFDPNGVDSMVGAAFDNGTDTVWIYGGFAGDLRQYSSAGTFQSSIDQPGESADDFDLDLVPAAFSLAGTPIPAHTMLAVNGESGVAEVYAVDKSSGAVLATLTTNFGLSHVVGGTYHRGRNSLFLVQDFQPSGTANDSVVAEIDVSTGAVLNSFKIDNILPGFTVNFGDIEASSATGNLFIVSDTESSIAEFTPTGTFVQQLALPAGVSNLSGIGLDELRGEAWVSSLNGNVYQLGGFPAIPEPSGLVLGFIAAAALGLWRWSTRGNRL